MTGSASTHKLKPRANINRNFSNNTTYLSFSSWLTIIHLTVKEWDNGWIWNLTSFFWCNSTRGLRLSGAPTNKYGCTAACWSQASISFSSCTGMMRIDSLKAPLAVWCRYERWMCTSTRSLSTRKYSQEQINRTLSICYGLGKRTLRSNSAWSSSKIWSTGNCKKQVSGQLKASLQMTIKSSTSFC